MKKKFLIISAIISLLLVSFPFTLCAEDAPASDPGDPPALLTPGLDSYFWDNYDLLPYIESTDSQYINTGIKGQSGLRIKLRISDFSFDRNGIFYIFGSRVASGNNAYGINYNNTNENLGFNFYNGGYSYSYQSVPYNIVSFAYENNDIYMNGNLIHSFNASTFNNNLNMYIFALNDNGNTTNYSYFKLYDFYIYDIANEEYLRYYYPARAKSGGTIGLYDAVSKTFMTTSGSVPFESPEPDQAIGFQISTFITSGLGWIGDILDFAIAEPVIILFMAIGLAGASIRWARRLVHF